MQSRGGASKALAWSEVLLHAQANTLHRKGQIFVQTNYHYYRQRGCSSLCEQMKRFEF